MSDTAGRDHRATLAEKVRAQSVSTLILLALPAVALASPSLEYEGGLAIGSPVLRPTSVTIGNQAETLCVTDGMSGTLDVFDAAGFHRFRTDESAGMSAPLDGAIDSEGRFVYIESGGREARTIGRLTFLGEPDSFRAEEPYSDWMPLHLTVSIDGQYLTIDGRGLLAKHNSVTGELVWTLQIVESDFERVDVVGRPAQGQDGSIYLPHAGLKQVFVATNDGAPRGSFGVPGSRYGELAFPIGVAVTGEGQVLVLDRFRHRVLIYGEDHVFAGEVGRMGEGPGDLYHPIAIAAMPDGRVVIAQGFEGRVQRYRLLATDFARKGSDSSS